VKVKLRDAFDLQMGKTPPRNDCECWGEGHKWISISDIGNAGKYIDTTKEEITDIGVSKCGIKIVPAGTVIMSFKLSIGKTAITAEDMYTNEAIMAFINKGKYEIDTTYLYHMCNGIDWLEGTNKAVLGLTLNKATMSEKEIEIPPLVEQLEAVAKLDKMDELIALRKEQFTKLDQLVKSRFIELFDSGYNTMPLQSVCEELFAGGDVKKDKSSSIRSDIYPYPIYTNGEKDNGLYGYTSIVRVEKEAVTISGRGTIGFTCLRTEPFYPAVRLIVAVPKQELVSGCYLKHFIQSKNYGGQGASIPQLTVPMIRDEPIPIPPMEIQEQFKSFVEQTDKSKLAIQQSLDKLELLKKSLMQEYFG
jgi:type I restriction enzyme S subunit